MTQLKTGGVAADQLRSIVERVEKLTEEKAAIEKPVVALESLDDEAVDGKPDGPAPVGIAAEHVVGGLAGIITDAVVVAVELEFEGVLEMIAGERTDAVRREEFLLIEEIAQHADQVIPRGEREEPFAGTFAMHKVAGNGAFDSSRIVP